jgi:hypothetical protein
MDLGRENLAVRFFILMYLAHPLSPVPVRVLNYLERQFYDMLQFQLGATHEEYFSFLEHLFRVVDLSKLEQMVDGVPIETTTSIITTTPIKESTTTTTPQQQQDETTPYPPTSTAGVDS